MESKAREEAERIYNKHYASIFEYGEELSEEIVVSLLAKKSALIHVDGIIKEYKELHYRCLSLSQYLPYIAFWQEVKQELKKMI